MERLVQNILQMQHLTQKLMGMRVEIEKAAKVLSHTVNYGGTIYIIGNGGSAADSNHFAGEILGRFKKERKGLPAVSLTADNATITAIANDYGYEHIFRRQLEGLFDPLTDILITMSTSGNSRNIMHALDYLHDIEGKSINLLGRDGGLINGITRHSKNKPELNIIIPAQDSDRIQEMHKFILHYFAEVIEAEWVSLKGDEA